MNDSTHTPIPVRSGIPAKGKVLDSRETTLYHLSENNGIVFDSNRQKLILTGRRLRSQNLLAERNAPNAHKLMNPETGSLDYPNLSAPAES